MPPDLQPGLPKAVRADALFMATPEQSEVCMIDIIHGWDTDLMATLFHEVWINAPTSRVYEKLSNAGGLSEWWTKHTATETDQGLVLESSPGPEHGIVRMKVLNLKQNARVEWECLSTHPRSSPASAWTGTHITFEITRRSVPPWAKEKTDMVILTLRHSGWDESSEFIGFCNFQWGVALQKLKQVCESRAEARTSIPTTT